MLTLGVAWLAASTLAASCDSPRVEEPAEQAPPRVEEPAEQALFVDANLEHGCRTYSAASRSCAGSDGRAFPTIDEAVAEATAGDTVWVRQGTYRIPLGAEIRLAADRIALSGYSSERPVIQGAGFDDSLETSDRSSLLRVSGDENVVRQLEIRDCPYRCLVVAGRGNLVEEVRAYHAWSSTAIISGSRNRVRYCEFAHARHGSGIGTAPRPRADDNVVERVLTYSNGRRPDGSYVPVVPGDPHGGGNSDGLGSSKSCVDDTPVNLCQRNTHREVISWHNADDGFDFQDGQVLSVGNVSFDNGDRGRRNFKNLRAGPDVPQGLSIGNVSMGTGAPPCGDPADCPYRGWEVRQRVDIYHFLGLGASDKDFIVASGSEGVVQTSAWGSGSCTMRCSNNSGLEGLAPFMPDLDLPEGTVEKRWRHLYEQFRSALTPAEGSPLIDAGVAVAGVHCDRADDDPADPMDPDADCRHWAGAAPDIGAFEAALQPRPPAASGGRTVSSARTR